MFRLRKSITFEAAHNLNDYKGVCANIHGHSYKIELFIIGDKLSKNGMIIDFKTLSATMNSWINNKYDHKYLNDIMSNNPTAENMAREMYINLSAVLTLKELDISVEKVRVWETADSWAEYYECE